MNETGAVSRLCPNMLQAHDGVVSLPRGEGAIKFQRLICTRELLPLVALNPAATGVGLPKPVPYTDFLSIQFFEQFVGAAHVRDDDAAAYDHRDVQRFLLLWARYA